MHMFFLIKFIHNIKKYVIFNVQKTYIIIID
jgi:hypothetical protein